MISKAIYNCKIVKSNLPNPFEREKWHLVKVSIYWLASYQSGICHSSHNHSCNNFQITVKNGHFQKAWPIDEQINKQLSLWNRTTYTSFIWAYASYQNFEEILWKNFVIEPTERDGLKVSKRIPWFTRKGRVERKEGLKTNHIDLGP